MEIRELQSALEEFLFAGQALREGIFDSLCSSPSTSNELADAMGFNRRAVEILLEALTELGYLQNAGGLYSVPDVVRAKLVDKNSEYYEADFWRFLFYLNNPWKTLHHVLKYGEPDQNSYKDFSIDDFIRAMDSPWKKKLSPEIVDICLRYCPGAEIVADIGGAPGTLAREFASRGKKTIVFDLPECLNVTRDELSAEKNIIPLAGDATQSIPRGPYDIAFLGNLCHGQEPSTNKQIIADCFENLAPGGIIAIFDNLRNENRWANTLALHMLTQSRGGNTYTRDEYEDWMSSAGFGNIIVVYLSDPAWSLVIGFK